MFTAPPLFADLPKCVIGDLLLPPITGAKLEGFFADPRVRAQEDAVDALICCLPLAMRTTPPYAFASRGLLQATADAPRTVLADEQGPSFISFSGRSPTVESIDASGEKFRFHAFHSRAKQPTRPELDSDRCERCHHDSLIWDSYYVWPGFFEGVESAPSSAKEKERWEAFKKAQPTLPRYRCLIEGYAKRNIDFGEKLLKLNAKRIARQLTSSSELKPLRAAILGALYCGPEFAAAFARKDFPIESFLPEKTAFARHATFAEVKKDTERRVLEEWRRRFARHDALQKELGAKGTEVDYLTDETDEYSKIIRKRSEDVRAGKIAFEGEIDRTARLRFLLENVLGTSMMSRWSFVFKGDAYEFNDGRHVQFLQESVGPLLLEKWRPGKTKDSFTDEECTKLASESRAELSKARGRSSTTGLGWRERWQQAPERAHQ